MKTYTDRRPPGFNAVPDHPVIALTAIEATQARNPRSDVRHAAREKAGRLLSVNADALYVAICDDRGKSLEIVARDLPRPVYVRIKRNTGRFRAGETVEIGGGIEWPGKPHKDGRRKSTKWVFQTSAEPGSLLIEASDIEAVIIPRNTIPWRKVLKDPPFEVEHIGQAKRSERKPAKTKTTRRKTASPGRKPGSSSRRQILGVAAAAAPKRRTTAGAKRRKAKGRLRSYLAERAEKIKFLTLDETRRLFAEIVSKRDKAIFLIAYRHGLRASEVGKLHRTDVDLKRKTVMIHRIKGSIGGRHPLQPDEIRALKSYLKERGDDGAPCLFPSNRGTPISRDQLDVMMKRYAGAAGVPKNKRYFHTLKHAIAAHLLDAGADLRFVQNWLGHANIQNTAIYTALVSKPREENARTLFMRLLKL